MKKHLTLSIAIASVLIPAQLPASSKPCRDKNGRVITCPKVRKPSPRCKDSQGRFVACSQPQDHGSPKP